MRDSSAGDSGAGPVDDATASGIADIAAAGEAERAHEAPAEAARQRLTGGILAFGAYVWWGLLPLYFLLLAPTGPWELVAWRILLSLVFCLVLLSAFRGWARFREITRHRRLLLWTAVAGLIIYVNWQVYVVAALSGHIVETSLGYFINPLVTVVLGVVVLRERLRLTQWVALGFAAAAVVVIVVGYGTFPWIALVLAFSFGAYGLIKKHIGPSVDAVSGLTLETAWLTPVAVVQLIIVANVSGLSYGANGVGHAVLLSFAGIITAVPLLLFAAGARRVPLTVIGLLQFVAPIMQFAIGVWILGEPMPLERWIGFALVWVALAVLTVDSLVFARRSRGVSDVAEVA